MGVLKKQQPVEAQQVVKQGLTLKEKISYGMGDFGNGFMFDLGQLYLLKFFTDVAGIAPKSAAGIFLASKLFAALCDPIIGAFIDTRKNARPNGKFRPVMLYGSMVLAVLTVFTFISPHLSPAGKLIYAYASYMIWGACYSFTNIPYGSLGAAITQDVGERTALASFRQSGSLGALFVTSVVCMPLITRFSNERVGYAVVMAAMSLIGVVSFYFCYRNTKERIVVQQPPKEKISLVVIAKTFVTNVPLLVIVLMTVFTISAYNIKTAMLTYFAQYNLGNKNLMAPMNFIIMGASLIGVLFLPKLVAKFGKKRTALIGMGVSIIADSFNFFLPTNVYVFTILATIAFIGISIPNGITWTFVSDIIDYGEWHSGERKEATTYSLFNFSRKLAQALAGTMAAYGLGMVGYVANVPQTAESLLGIKGLLLLYPAVALCIAMLVLGLLYKLNDNKHKAIVIELQKKNLE
ncbi:glycoside-pentoside-hexuronide (GPH):cation symporter [Saccharibacillus sp. CPCC 101409]|uniref:glycoside-pentoside-hexuronide (GPH):cation symporter n=1 Tax=Saccharibacillus sp. CPCC 101409 TaxID=3058041 RepID=UPI002670D871|nr:glycoside-pentoside-hexuronide (GPH):cation symporter [Saccharibacillus sp. CPCC 101409]MDO3410792.1 glycoside-pentoside-hexuronide (GPH):cation symporter [Saccharibacillus sp. CPCC 101409]